MKRDHLYQQYFLKSPRLVAELIGHTNIRKNDVVYDLGAGSGVISAVLARRAKEVVAVESDKRIIPVLSQNLAKHQNTQIIKKDILRLRIPSGSYKIFANIPFKLSSSVVEKFAFSDNPPQSMNLITQRQFAQKLVQSDRHFTSALGAKLWPWFNIRIRKPLRRSDFTPPPAVDTVLLEIKPRLDPLLSVSSQSSYSEFVLTCFSSQQFFSQLDKKSLGISAERKPSELSQEDWVQLFLDYDRTVRWV